MPSAVFLLKNGMHYDCLKGTVRYHIKGHNCKTSYQPKFQTSQWSHEGQSCFWEIFCPGSNPLTSSSPVIPAHSFSSNLKDEWVKKHLTNIHHRKLNLKSSELWSWMDLFFISFSPQQQQPWRVKRKKERKKNGFMFKRKAIDPGLHMRQKMDADLPSLP